MGQLGAQNCVFEATEKIKNVPQNHLCTLKFSTTHNTYTLSLSLSLSLSHQRATNGSFVVVGRSCVVVVVFVVAAAACVERTCDEKRGEEEEG